MDPRLVESRRQERAAARTFGAQQHTGSGSAPYNKNDMHTDRLHIECKTTVRGTKSKQITLKKDDLDDVLKQAVQLGRIPGLTFDLGTSWIAIPNADLAALIEELEALREKNE
jgi:hypothetical protein